MAQTSSFVGSESGEVGVLLYRATSLSAWDSPPSHDQTVCNISMMVLLDLYSHGHNFLAICSCNISIGRDLFLVPFLLGLIRAPKSSARHSCVLIKGPCFSLNFVGRSPIHHQFITSTGVLVMSHRSAEITEPLLGSLCILL